MNPLDGTGISVGELLSRAAAASEPDRVALVFVPESHAEPLRWTYAELQADAERAAGWLVERFPPAARVAIWATNAPQWTILQLGIALAGLVLVPVNPSCSLDEAAYLLGSAGVAGLFHDRDADIVERLCSDHSIGTRSSLSDAAAAWSRAAPAARAVEPSDVAQIQFTSGTSGRPKGALLTHAGLTTTPVVASRCLGLSDPARWLNVTPLFHIGGCVLPVMGCLALRATHVLGARFQIDRVLDTFGRESITFFGGVPTMWWDLLSRYDPRRHDVASLEVLMTGGAPVPDALVRQAERTFGARIVVAYGQTEAHGHITQTHIVDGRDDGDDPARTIGRPLPHTTIRIAREDGTTAAPGETGELVARSPTLMRGYLDRPEETARAIDESGALHTGDLCRQDEHGVVRFVGRISELINRGGEKIVPLEVESVLALHPLVERAAVAGVPDHRLGERVAAFVVPAGHSGLDVSELREFVRSRLARYKVPEVWEVVTELPLGPSGKVAKGELVGTWTAKAPTP